jgi:ethanolamine utilization protein EutS
VEPDKPRVIQEYVPGKQVTLSHLIAHPQSDLYERIGLESAEAMGILTLTPGESAIIAADIATKAADVQIGFLDRFTGALVITGEVAAVQEALTEVNRVLSQTLQFTPSPLTRT